MKNKFSDLELNILAEVGNISVGGGASSLSDFLQKTVNISIPRVRIMEKNDVIDHFGTEYMAVRINYVEGINTSNLMVLELKQAREFAEIVIKKQIPSYTPEEWGDMTEEVLKEVFNIMIGNMAASLSEVLGKYVKIDTPKFITTEKEFEVKTGPFITTWFDLRIENDMKITMVDIVEEEQARLMLNMIKEEQDYGKYE